MNEQIRSLRVAANDGSATADAVLEKLDDAATLGYLAEFDPAEAERAGAFAEDALSEADALDSACDYPMGFSSPAKQ